MHLPRRTVKSIQPLPSIHTAFTLVQPHNNDSGENLGRCPIKQIEDGIEMVPFERSNVLSAPILSPDQGYKEVLIQRKSPLDKPLPKPPPKPLWERLSVRQRMLAIFSIQCALLLSIGLGLMAVNRRSSPNKLNLTATIPNEDSSLPKEVGSMPTGSYAVPIRMQQSHDSACLALMNESVAWQCASDTTFRLDIHPPYLDSSNKFVQLTSLSSSPGTFYHGHQAPEIQPAILRHASDIEGPIYHFNATYDHVVLLRERDFTSLEQPTEKHPAFKKGDTLWRCVFNQVRIEGCIFINQNTTVSQPLNRTTAVTQPLQYPKIPHLLKLVGQRVPNGEGAYCEKMKVQDSTLASVSGEKKPLNLADPKAEVDASKPKLTRSTKFRARQQVPGSKLCGCQWKVE